MEINSGKYAVRKAGELRDYWAVVNTENDTIVTTTDTQREAEEEMLRLANADYTAWLDARSVREDAKALDYIVEYETRYDKNGFISLLESYIPAKENITPEMYSIERCAKLIDAVYDAKNLPQESAWLVLKGDNDRLVGVSKVTTGTMNVSLVHPREFLQRAILNPEVKSVTFMHNHPSGNIEISKEDKESVQRLAECFGRFGIPLTAGLIAHSKGRSGRRYLVSEEIDVPMHLSPQYKADYILKQAIMAGASSIITGVRCMEIDNELCDRVISNSRLFGIVIHDELFSVKDREWHDRADHEREVALIEHNGGLVTESDLELDEDEHER